MPNPTITSTDRRLQVRLAEDQLEIEKTLALRYEVFNLEMKEGLQSSAATGKDRDEYDLYCDHLIVVDCTKDDKIVGTYRLLRGSVARKNIGFYSENEFNLSALDRLDGEVAEIGRSCVHKDYRDGSVISMLWIGLGSYMNQFNVRYLSGCASLHTTDPLEASEMYACMKEKEMMADPRYQVEPLPTHHLEGFNPEYQIDDVKAAYKRMPALLKGYVRAGARFCSEPAIDREFGTIDFYIIFDKKEVDKRYGRHYL
ncbi:MAG: GNAT family N-acetyltransferase [Leptospiraceae bacterium]|nr:GNAT family N-acetyltransferase [Leptospiraceae bacterium]MCB1303688.1 GNAT family N-acetyltransferase [Leptospiraceae bacterium]